MRKLIILALAVIVMGLSVFFGYTIYNNNNKSNVKNLPNESKITEISEVIIDDCTDEYNYEQNQELLTTNSEEEKISPSAIIKIEKNYQECRHTIVEEKSVNTNLVNKTKQDLEKEYEGWEVKKFSSNEIVISKQFEGRCNEEFVLRDVEGRIVIYKINNENKEVEYEKTDISTDYLTQTDKNNINNGLKVIGIWELNKVIEDFE